MNAPTTSTSNKIRLPEMTATTKGRWGNIEVLYSTGLTRRRKEIYTTRNALGKGLGKTE